MNHLVQHSLAGLVLVLLACQVSHGSPFGPPYPVTGAWFKDRFSLQEWNGTLEQFSKIGGDTVILRAPAIKVLDLDGLRQDLNFKWCGRFRNNPSADDRDCYTEALDELRMLGVSVAALATYEYEEGFDDTAIIRCPQYERKIVSDRIYYRLVLPLSAKSTRQPCDLNGADVLVLFASFAGVDPHALLLQAAQKYNMSVYFGLPLPPIYYHNGGISRMNFTVAYFDFLGRVLLDHKSRYASNGSLNDTLQGYFWSEDFLLTHAYTAIGDSGKINYLSFFKNVSLYVQGYHKRFGISALYQANVFENSSSLTAQNGAFNDLAIKGLVNVISVKDGRGSAFGSTFWDTQLNSTIATTDTGLMKILELHYPFQVNNQTRYSDVYRFSIKQIFDQLSLSRDKVKKLGHDFDLWLDIEAYDDLHDDPCQLVDRAGSGMDRMVNSVSKSRLDKILTHAGTCTQKIVSSSWDPGFTCETRAHGTPLRYQIQSDNGRPIIAHCSFHSSFNRSVVVIGYSLDAETQGFTINWPNVNGHRVSSEVHGYYFELDWGIQHQRVPSLMYIQTYDPYDVMNLAPKGYVKVTVDSGYHGCAFEYDFTNETPKPYTDDIRKKHYRIKQKPIYRLYGQDIVFK